jgi:putative DNA methylase
VTEYRKKLIEVALPLTEVNDASAYDKLPGIGAHPKNMHQWWARLPLPTARAVLFASIIDDPSANPEFIRKSKGEQDRERERLFQLIRKLLVKKPTPESFEEAREELRRACGGELPPVLDPFCGGGSIPLEAQRLGFLAIAADLNPVAALITKALIEIPIRFSGKPPVNPEAQKQRQVQPGGWKGAHGLAEDVRYYGKWIGDEAERRIGLLYPMATLPREVGGGTATVIAWLWARAVKCPNPACGAQMPLVRSFALSTKRENRVWLKPVVNRGKNQVHFQIDMGSSDQELTKANSTGTCVVVNGKKANAKFRCAVCTQGIADGAYIDIEAGQGRMGVVPLAVVVEKERGRTFLPFGDLDAAHISKLVGDAAAKIRDRVPHEEGRGTFAGNAQGRYYGFKTFADYFTLRQLVAMVTFGDLVSEAISRARRDAAAAGLPDDDKCIEAGGAGARAYAEGMGTYLAFALDRLADYNCSLSRWVASGEQIKGLFGRQSIPIVWDFAEANVLGPKGITWLNQVKFVSDGLEATHTHGRRSGQVVQRDVAGDPSLGATVVLSTDPPYYDNIGYADLSDFFYVWLRRSLKPAYPQLFSTVLTPKVQELIASPYRFGGDKEKAREHFESGFKSAFVNLRPHIDSRFPMTLYYAFKQEEQEDEGDDDELHATTRTTGWETFLEAVTSSGFQVTATWPVRASQKWRLVATGANALASYIVIACRPRPERASLSTRQEFMRELKHDLPDAILKLQRGSIAPVDLAQASIGPGMAIFSKYARVVEADGRAMTVRTALQIINQILGELLAEQEGEFDPGTRWCLQWFKQHGTSDGDFGEAELLSKAMNTSIPGLVQAGVLNAQRGKVRLRDRQQFAEDWDPVTGRRFTTWEATQHLIRTLESGGDQAAAVLLARLGATGDLARELAYILHRICESKGWTQEALPYNSLVVGWPEIARIASGRASAKGDRRLESFGEPGT